MRVTSMSPSGLLLVRLLVLGHVLVSAHGAGARRLLLVMQLVRVLAKVLLVKHGRLSQRA